MRTEGVEMSLDAARTSAYATAQNRNRRWNWKVRPSFSVLAIWPKLGEVKSVPGSANCGVFRKLMDSARKVRLLSGARAQVRDKDAFMFRIPPRRNTPTPRFPRDSFGPMKAKADFGSSRTEVSGLLTVRPRMEASSRLGRSPGEPSTFPKPAPSEPEKTVKGGPVLASSTAEISHRPAMWRTIAGL